MSDTEDKVFESKEPDLLPPMSVKQPMQMPSMSDKAREAAKSFMAKLSDKGGAEAEKYKAEHPEQQNAEIKAADRPVTPSELQPTDFVPAVETAKGIIAGGKALGEAPGALKTLYSGFKEALPQYQKIATDNPFYQYSPVQQAAKAALTKLRTGKIPFIETLQTPNMSRETSEMLENASLESLTKELGEEGGRRAYNINQASKNIGSAEKFAAENKAALLKRANAAQAPAQAVSRNAATYVGPKALPPMPPNNAVAEKLFKEQSSNWLMQMAGLAPKVAPK